MNRLKELRLRTKYNQTQLANILGIPRNSYNKYELGNVEPDIATLKIIANFYNVSLDYLCDYQSGNQIGYILDERRETVKKLASLNDIQFEKVSSYIDAIIDMN